MNECILTLSGIKIENHNFVLTMTHRIPGRIIISVPHDRGLPPTDFVGLLPERKRGIKGRDKHVFNVARDILLRSLGVGVRVDLIRFLLPRALVDANRALPGMEHYDAETKDQLAADFSGLFGTYLGYYKEIDRLLARSVEAHGARNVLFIDLHGFAHQPAIAPEGGFDLILGTANRATVYSPIDQQFANFMREKGYEIFLPSEVPFSRSAPDPYGAGHITRRISNRFSVDSIQIETASRFRRDDAAGLSDGKKLAEDLASFFRKFFFALP